MTVAVTGETKRKLDHVPDRIKSEFPQVPSALVDREVEAIAEFLVGEARFPDFVPLLTYRYARERVLDDGYTPLPKAA